MEGDPQALAGRLVRRLSDRDGTISCAESCTGGLLASVLTDLSGASRWFAGSIVAYTPTAKVEFLGVADSSIERKGTISVQVAREMASGIRSSTRSDLGISITGVAGPDEDEGKEPGTVVIGLSFAPAEDPEVESLTIARRFDLPSGTRTENKTLFVTTALEYAMEEWDRRMESLQRYREDEEKERERMAEELRQAELEELRREEERLERLSSERARLVDPEWSEDADWEGRQDDLDVEWDGSSPQ